MNKGDDSGNEPIGRQGKNIIEISTEKECADDVTAEPVGNNATPPGPLERQPFFVVSLGASAGGLETLEQFFSHMPPDSGMAFVVVVHLDPTHKTLLPELLGRYTQMEVWTAEEGMTVEPNAVYVIPANRDMTINGGQLHLEEPQAPRGMRHTIDVFLRSLATDMEENAIAVILSGTGTDGSQGVKAVKEAGGVVVVQEEATAKYPGMPHCAIATGVADLILPTHKMPEKILEITHRSTLLAKRKDAEPARQATEQLRAIFRIVNSRTGHDFSSYKASTIMRRIERRMAVNDIIDINDYIRFLKDRTEESRALFKEFLIGVTSFFRDPGAFEALERQVLPRLLEDRDPNEPLRIWLAGCATGEEAYTVAMLIQEYSRDHRVNLKVQIFATDLDGEAVEFARNGLYPDSIGADFASERLRTFFKKSDSTYQVVKPLREMIVFAQHNIIKDPPFSRLDLLICRNLLIYLNPVLQKRILLLFAQSLKPNGYLFLGTSETVGSFTDLFLPVDKKWKIFRRRESGKRRGIEFPIASLRPPIPEGEPVRPYQEAGLNPGMLAEKILTQRYSPPCVVINEKFEVVYFSTRTSRYLELPVGEPTQNLLKMAKADLRPALRAAVHKALTDQQAVVYQGLKVTTDFGEETIDLRVEPIATPPAAKGLALVIFEPMGTLLRTEQQPMEQREPTGEDEPKRDIIIKQLEEQLRITNEQLQYTIERMETSNEELKSSNEELMSINEEFQSTNEELETSKEELQALNEELVTVNAELQNKIDELGQSNSDLQNFFSSTDIATIFLDRQFRVKRFSPAMAKLFNLIVADIGRPLKHFTGVINYPELQEDAENVLVKLTPVEREIYDTERQLCYLVRVLPYRTMEDVIDGVVVTFIDITTRKQMEDERLRQQNLLTAIMQTTDVMLVYLDTDFNFLTVNKAYADTCNMTPEEMVGKNHFKLYPNAENEAIFRQVRESGKSIFFKDKPFMFPDQPERGITYWDWSLVPVKDVVGSVTGFVFSLRETTQYKLLEVELRESEELYRAIGESINYGVWVCEPDGRNVYASPSFLKLVGMTQEQCSNFGWGEVLHPDDAADTIEAWKDCVRKGEAWYREHRFRGVDGKWHPILARGVPVRRADGTLKYWAGINLDISELKQSEADLASRNAKLEVLLGISSLPDADEKTIADHVLTSIIKMTESKYGFYGFVNEDETAITIHSWSQEALQECSMADKPDELSICTAGIWAEVVRLRKPLILNNYAEANLANKGLPEGHVSLSSLLVVPFISKGRITAVAAVANRSAEYTEHDATELTAFLTSVQVITDSKRMELELKSSEERFRTFFDNAPLMLSISEIEDGAYVDVNRKFCEDSQFEYDEVVGRRSTDIGLISKEDRSRLIEELRNSGRVANLSLVLHRRDGNELPVLYFGELVEIAHRQMLLSIGLNQAEQKKLESQLQQAQRLESIGRLAGGVAHDFNNMLMVIIGHAELALMHTNLNQQIHDNLEEIKLAAGRSADLTRQLLAFARKQIISPKVLDLNDTVAGILRMLQRLIGEDISLAWQPATSLWPVKVDPSQIDQILANLCVNARDSISNNGRMAIETANCTVDEYYARENPDAVPGDYVALTVSDNGCGMDKETLSHIFEPFFTTKGVGEGTGLGLATVYGAVKQNGGFITVYSELGVGTKFTIHIPRHMSQAGQADGEQDEEQLLYGNETILLVEDEPSILNIASMLLTEQGYTVLKAKSPGEAVELAKQSAGTISLLMTDVIMPEVNGRDLAQQLQTIYPNLKVLFMSGYTADVVAHHGVLGNGVHFIQKPFSLPNLATKVREVLDSN